MLQVQVAGYVLANLITAAEHQSQSALGANQAPGATNQALAQSAQRLEAPQVSTFGSRQMLTVRRLHLQFARQIVGQDGRPAIHLVAI